METILIHIGQSVAKLVTVSVLLPGTGTLALFAYTWWARRRALRDA